MVFTKSFFKFHREFLQISTLHVHLSTGLKLISWPKELVNQNVKLKHERSLLGMINRSEDRAPPKDYQSLDKTCRP